LSFKQENKIPVHIYGPVPSRRLGFSLGIDIIPYKTCTLDCIYCQLGVTSQKSSKRKKYFSAPEILSQIKKSLSSGLKIDIITFSGSGEPTLNQLLGKLIREIKKLTSIPVAVLTNGTLFSQESVRQALMAADLVIPSLDAADQGVFEKINRPCSALKIEDIIESLKVFRQEFKGLIWLEIMLVKRVNDSPLHLRKLRDAVLTINPDKVQLNTVVRPPAEKFAQPLKLEELDKIRKFFGKNCEIIADFDKKAQEKQTRGLQDAIWDMIQRRPLTLMDLSAALGRHKNEIIKALNLMMKEGKVRMVTHKGLKYFEPA